jgi:hypothetical protein
MFGMAWDVDIGNDMSSALVVWAVSYCALLGWGGGHKWKNDGGDSVVDPMLSWLNKNRQWDDGEFVATTI